jgi:hypothetical protein
MTGAARIEDEAGYGQALAELRGLWGAAPGTPAGDRVGELMDGIGEYEDRHWAIGPPEPAPPA